FATMVDGEGKGFHKSAGNSIEFVEGAQTASADVLRWMCARQNPSENLLFSYKLADEVRRQFHLKLWNVYNFFVTYANTNNWTPKEENSFKVEHILDVWILARLAETI